MVVEVEGLVVVDVEVGVVVVVVDSVVVVGSVVVVVVVVGVVVVVVEVVVVVDVVTQFCSNVPEEQMVQTIRGCLITCSKKLEMSLCQNGEPVKIFSSLKSENLIFSTTILTFG